MLSLIYDVPWATLRSASGDASAVPQHILGLASRQYAQRSEARGGLQNTICKVGMRYESALPAVPFLFDLLDAPATLERHRIISLLVHIALGLEWGYLPQGIDPDEFRRQCHARAGGCATADQPAGTGPLIDLACYDMVRGGIHTFVNLLDDHEGAVRAHAAHAVAWFPEHAAESLPPLLDRFQHGDDDQNVFQAQMLAIGLLARRAHCPEAPAAIEPFLCSEELQLRVPAALTLAREPLAPELRQILCEALLRAGKVNASVSMPFRNGDLASYAVATLLAWDPPGRDKALELLGAAFAGAEEENEIINHAHTILEIIMDFRALMPRSRYDWPELLEDWQISALRLFVDHSHWEPIKFGPHDTVLASFGLPPTREGLRVFLASLAPQTASADQLIGAPALGSHRR